MATDEEPIERFGQPDAQVERAVTSADEVEGTEFIGTDAGNPADGWTDPPEGHTEAPIDRDDALRRKG
jgi:hypothetical protein